MRNLAWTNATSVEHIGEGAWSSAFGFRHGDRDLVIRLGRHETDSRRDQSMSKLATPALPIPDVLDVGQAPGAEAADGLFYCISTRALGEPLELCSNDEWRTVVERVADTLEAMHALTPAAVDTAVASVSPWEKQLLSIERDDLDPRGAGWPAKLATSKRGSAAFQLGLAHLRELDVGEVALTLVHGDLINRNVHIDDGTITGIFDWGCQRWGDHLFDLAWFDFWSPWFPNLDIGVLREARRERWSEVVEDGRDATTSSTTDDRQLRRLRRNRGSTRSSNGFWPSRPNVASSDPGSALSRPGVNGTGLGRGSVSSGNSHAGSLSRGSE